MYYIVKIKFDKHNEQADKLKKATEQFIIDGERFADVENVATKIMTDLSYERTTPKGEKVMTNKITGLVNAEFDVVSIARTKYVDAIGDVAGLFEHIDNTNVKLFEPVNAPSCSQKWYKCRIGHPTMTDSGNDTIEHIFYLVGARTMEQAREIIAKHADIEQNSVFGNEDFIECVDETRISDVYIMKPKEQE